MTMPNLLPLFIYLILMLTPFNSIEPDDVSIELEIIDSNPTETFIQFQERRKTEDQITQSHSAMVRAIARYKQKERTKKCQYLTLLKQTKSNKGK